MLIGRTGSPKLIGPLEAFHECDQPPPAYSRSLCREPRGLLSRCSANGHHVDPVELFRFILQTRLDALYQRLDLSTAEAIVDVDSSHEPDSARADEGDEEFTNSDHTGVPQKKGLYSL